MRQRKYLLVGAGALIVATSVTLSALIGGSPTTAAVGTPTGIPTARWATSLPLPSGAPPLPSYPPKMPTPRRDYASITQPTISPQYGVPAITPTLSTSDPNAAAFTEQDVRAYYAKAQAKGGKASTITRISFLTVGEALAAFSLPLPFDKNELVCVVQIAEAGTAGSPDTVKSYTTVFETYSARTGSLLNFTYR